MTKIDVDAQVASKIGALEITKMRMASLLESQRAEIVKLHAVVAQRDAEIAALNDKLGVANARIENLEAPLFAASPEGGEANGAGVH